MDKKQQIRHLDTSSRVESYTGSVEILRPLAERWFDECNPEPFGLVLDVNDGLRRMQSMVDSTNADLFILIHEEYIKGFLGLEQYTLPIGPNAIAYIHCIYILPKLRWVGAAKLIAQAKHWAREHDCGHLLISVSRLSNSSPERLAKLYDRKGFMPFESIYIHAIDQGDS